MSSADYELTLLRDSAASVDSDSPLEDISHNNNKSSEHLRLTQQQQQEAEEEEEPDLEPNPSKRDREDKAAPVCCTCGRWSCKKPSRRRCCCYVFVSFLLLTLTAVLIWRAVMGAKFGKVDEGEAHLTFDSPIPSGSGSKYSLQPAIDSSKSVKLLVWNLRKEEWSGMETDLPQQSSDRDLLILSEGYLNARGQAIFNSLSGVHWEMGVSFTYKRDNDSPTGTMIGSHVLPSWAIVKQSVDTEPIINTPKCMTFAKYPLSVNGSGPSNSSSSSPSAAASNSTQLLVISIHAVNAVSVDALDRQLQQAAEEILVHTGPVIFAGDFNTNTATKVQRMRDLIKSLSMQEVSFINGDERKTVFGQYIDYVFTRGFKVVGDAIVLANITSSDHKALKLELQLA